MKRSFKLLAVAMLGVATNFGVTRYQDHAAERASVSRDQVHLTIPDRDGARGRRRIGAFLSLDIEERYLSQPLVVGFVDFPELAINYKTLEPTNVIPMHGHDSVMVGIVPIGYETLNRIIAPDNKQNKILGIDEGTVNVEAGSFEDEGIVRHGLSYRTYKTVDVDGYPFSELFLKKDGQWNFYVYCGLNKVPELDLCKMVFAIMPTGEVTRHSDSDDTLAARIVVHFRKENLKDWRLIESNVRSFLSPKLGTVVD